MEIRFFEGEEIHNDKLKYAVIAASYNGKWVFVKHKERNTWETPGGHREPDENINFTAERELYEETGAIKSSIQPICDYSVTIDSVTTYGRLFYSEVKELGSLPESEIGEVSLFDQIPEQLTYQEVMLVLFVKVKEYLGGTNKTKA
jgi:8-oxo-dGTP diphosphatase